MIAAGKATASTVGEVVREVLEYMHFMYEGPYASYAGDRAGSFVAYLMQQPFQKYQDKENPAHPFDKKAKTPYYFQASDENSPEKINKQAKKYLTQLESSVRNLDKAKKYFQAFEDDSNKVIKNIKNNYNCLANLISLKKNLEYFKENFEKFLFSIESPRRHLLYIASLNNKTVILRYNSLVLNINNSIKKLEELEQKIAKNVKENFLDTHTAQRAPSPRSVHSGHLQHQIERGGYDPEKLLEIMRARLPNNIELADFCADIIEKFSQIYQMDVTNLKDPFKDDPNWAPLLITQELIEVGQRIVVHLLNTDNISENEKLLIAEFFFRTPVSKHEINQIKIDQLAYEMASHLRSWQIENCSNLIEFLSALKEGNNLPTINRNDKTVQNKVLRWLQKNVKKQSSLQLLKEILVEPCSFSMYQENKVEENEPAAYTLLKKNLPEEVSDKLIQKHFNNYWGDNWEKNDSLIQFPQAFNSTRCPTPNIEPEYVPKKSMLVSAAMANLAQALIVDLRHLKLELENSKDFYLDTFNSLREKQEQLREIEKNQAHEMGVERIQKSKIRTSSINSPINSLYSCLNRPATFNQADKKRQVPTVDDLLQVIYLGVDPNEICPLNTPNQKISETHQDISYVKPSKEQRDSRTKAWLYDSTFSQSDKTPALTHVFFIPKSSDVEVNPKALATEMAAQNSLSLQSIQTTAEEQKKTPSRMEEHLNSPIACITKQIQDLTERQYEIQPREGAKAAEVANILETGAEIEEKEAKILEATAEIEATEALIIEKKLQIKKLEAALLTKQQPPQTLPGKQPVRQAPQPSRRKTNTQRTKGSSVSAQSTTFSEADSVNRPKLS